MIRRISSSDDSDEVDLENFDVPEPPFRSQSCPRGTDDATRGDRPLSSSASQLRCSDSPLACASSSQRSSPLSTPASDSQHSGKQSFQPNQMQSSVHAISHIELLFAQEGPQPADVFYQNTSAGTYLEVLKFVCVNLCLIFFFATSAC
ncbi:uncharacterized protein LOC144133627 [Amblyomma americanum]